MYVATQNFTSYKQGEIKKGDEVEFNQTFLDHGLIELIEHKEIKPEPKKRIKTK